MPSKSRPELPALRVSKSTSLNSSTLSLPYEPRTGAVPVAGDGLGVEGDDDAELLGNTLEQVAGDPELVARGDALAGAHLLG